MNTEFNVADKTKQIKEQPNTNLIMKMSRHDKINNERSCPKDADGMSGKMLVIALEYRHKTQALNSRQLKNIRSSGLVNTQ